MISNLDVCGFTFRRYTLDYYLKAVKDLGLKNIELYCYHPHFSIYEAEELDAKKIADKIKDAGIKVDVIEPEQNFYPINIISSNEYLRNKSIEQIKFYIKSAPLFDCHKVTLLPGKNLMDEDYEESLKLLIKQLKDICAYAKEYGVDILLENVSDSVSGMIPNMNAVKRIIDGVDADNLKLAVNTSAVYLYGEDIQTWFDTFKDKISHIELSDASCEDEQFELGTGEVDIKHILDVLKKENYQGTISLHLTMEEYAEEPIEPYKNSIDYLKKLGEE